MPLGLVTGRRAHVTMTSFVMARRRRSGSCGGAPCMAREERRAAELRLANERYNKVLSEHRRAAEMARADEVVEALREAAEGASRGGFISKAFSILRARSASSDKMCAIFGDGCGKDMSSLCSAADGFREELLRQGRELYAGLLPSNLSRLRRTSEPHHAPPCVSQPAPSLRHPRPPSSTTWGRPLAAPRRQQRPPRPCAA